VCVCTLRMISAEIFVVAARTPSEVCHRLASVHTHAYFRFRFHFLCLTLPRPSSPYSHGGLALVRCREIREENAQLFLHLPVAELLLHHLHATHTIVNRSSHTIVTNPHPVSPCKPFTHARPLLYSPILLSIPTPL